MTVSPTPEPRERENPNDSDSDASTREYVRGPVHPNTKHTATFEYKRTSPDHTGGGYPRWHSNEHRPDTAADRKQRVFVSIHRLCAVAWLFEDDVTAEEILQSRALEGMDVHHELGMPSANIEGELSLRDHGTHSDITQTQVRAWAEDHKRSAQAAADGGTAFGEDSAGCATPGCDGDEFATTESLDAAYCMDCIREQAPEGETIEVIQ